MLFIYISILIVSISFLIYRFSKMFIRNANIELLNQTIKNIGNSDILFIVDSTYDYNSNYVISINDSEKFIDVLRKNAKTNKPLYLIVHCHGGNVTESDIIINSILKHNNVIYVFIPKYAESAAALLSLAAKKIYMDYYAYLTPTDPQICNDNKSYSSKILIDALKNNAINDPYIILDALDAKVYHDDNIETLRKIMSTKTVNKSNLNKIIDIFASGRLPHHYPIGFSDLRDLGLPVENYIPNQISEIFNLYLENL